MIEKGRTLRADGPVMSKVTLNKDWEGIANRAGWLETPAKASGMHRAKVKLSCG